ncbi:hypothetical protein DE146DRAFT_751541 [Phaeosphaeria sp. MPI-PUGE-AT-0046c]|nr:hypothetical protein DE146DRAFT_751541 [Phaeosphaeria sp. MPI-PUGE-AT-0046c]
MSPHSLLIDILSLVGIACFGLICSHLTRLVRQRRRHASTSPFDIEAQCAKDSLGLPLRLPSRERYADLEPALSGLPSLKNGNGNGDVNVNVTHTSDHIEMVGVAPRAASYLDVPQYVIYDDDENDELLPAAFSEINRPSSLRPSAFVSCSREKRAAVVRVETTSEDDDEDEDDAHMGGKLVARGSMQVKGVSVVKGDWEEAEVELR